MAESDSLLKRLLEYKVEFVVVGGYAAAAYGVTLVTFDIDIACSFTIENLLRLQDALEDLHPVHRMTPPRIPFKIDQQSCQGLKNLYLSTDWGQLDCLSHIAGVGGFDRVLQNSIVLNLPIGACRFLTLDALIAAKEALRRPRDQVAVVQLRAIRERMQTKPPGTTLP